jgi:hypothetical protein
MTSQHQNKKKWILITIAFCAALFLTPYLGIKLSSPFNSRSEQDDITNKGQRLIPLKPAKTIPGDKELQDNSDQNTKKRIRPDKLADIEKLLEKTN